MAEKVSITKFNQPVCLPQPDFIITPEMNLTLVGFGAMRANESHGTLKRRTVDVKLFDFGECNKLFKSIEANKQFCAGGEEGKDSCRGDSGGPVFIKIFDMWFMIGITSYGYPLCGTMGKPGVYTNVVNYLGWIKEIVLANSCNEN